MQQTAELKPCGNHGVDAAFAIPVTLHEKLITGFTVPESTGRYVKRMEFINNGGVDMSTTEPSGGPNMSRVKALYGQMYINMLLSEPVADPVVLVHYIDDDKK